ncbi:MAG: cytochrome c3 family protein [Thermoanaerobaculia bacterium]
MQIFHRSANTLSRFSIFGALFVAGFGLWFLYQLNQSPYATQQRVAKEQPVPFSHEHHVAGLGIDCRYCHTSVEESSFAGIPPTATCMNCHRQIWTNAKILEPVRASLRTGVPLEWRRVHRLPEFVQFNHSIHVQKGIGCVSCHGRVDQMSLIHQDKPLTMSWCLECHRAPEKFVRPKEHVFDMAWTPDEPQKELGARLVREYNIRSKTSCSYCHY